jgi:hypothetical protein
MIRNLSQVAIAVENKYFQFAGEIDASLPQWKEALFQMTKYIAQVEEQVACKNSESSAPPPAEQQSQVDDVN